jgi:hypothetical protein
MQNHRYQIACAALFGWLLFVGAAPTTDLRQEPARRQNQTANAAQRHAAQTSGAILRSPANPRPDPGCQRGQENRQSELCAQWKAADAANMAAWGALVGILVTSFGTLGLFWQITLTRKAVRDTSNATVAMREANAIARQSLRIANQPNLILKTRGGLMNPDMLQGFHSGPTIKQIVILLDVAVVNCSKSVAIVERHGLWVKGGSPEEIKTTFFTASENKLIIFERATYGGMFDNNSRDELMINPPIFQGVIDYVDTLGFHRRQHFAFKQPSVWSNDFLEWGGSRFNRVEDAGHGYQGVTEPLEISPQEIAEERLRQRYRPFPDMPDEKPFT